MDNQAWRDEIEFAITGGVVDCELDTSMIDKILNHSLREVQRYIDTTAIITIPYQQCIDMSQYKINAVAFVRRAESFSGNATQSGVSDPMYVSQWQLLSSGNLTNFQSQVMDYAAWNTMLQIRNTNSTDLSYFYDKTDDKLYINSAVGVPSLITVGYIPRYDNVEDVKSDFWIDVIMRMAVANAKIAVGRIRSKFKLSNPLWTMDGDTMLEEGKTELATLRDQLREATALCYPID